MSTVSYLTESTVDFYNDVFTKTYLQYSNVDVECGEYLYLFINDLPIEMVCSKPINDFNIFHDRLLSLDENRFELFFYESNINQRTKVIPKDSICFVIKKNVDSYTFQRLIEDSVRQSTIPKLRHNILSFQLGEVSDINQGKLCTYNTYKLSKDNQESVIAWGCFIPNALFDLNFSSKPYVGYSQYISSSKEEAYLKLKESFNQMI